MGIKNFDGNVNADYLKETAVKLGGLKVSSYELMQLTVGNKVLDIGCGPGIDVGQLAELIGDTGEAVGLDQDPAMLAEAQSKFQRENVRFVQGSVMAIPFADNYFDAVRAERLFQVLPPSLNPDEVIREIIRVTKPAGRIVLLDTDWGSASLDYEDTELTQRLLHFFAARCRPNGYAGRQFFSLMKRNQLSVDALQIVPYPMLDFDETPYRQWLIKEALEHGVATQTELNQWETALATRSERGEFYAAVNMVLIAGSK